MSSISIEWPDLMMSSSNGTGAGGSHGCSREYVSWSAEASSRLSVLDNSWSSNGVADLDSSSVDVNCKETTSDSSSNAYKFVDLAAQINELVVEDGERSGGGSPPQNLIPLDLTFNANEQRFEHDTDV